jgi:Fe-S cluster assembly protein SufD
MNGLKSNMEYVVNDKLDLTILNNESIKLIINKEDIEVNIIINPNINTKIIEQYENININYKLNIRILNNSTLDFISYNTNKNDINLDMNVSLSNNSYFKSYIGMFGEFTNNKYTINLNGKNSNTVFNVMTYNDNNSSQTHTIEVNHLKENTISNIINCGVLKNKSNIKFDVKSYIKNGCKNSNANQKSKVICLDNDSNATISPILLIDEYDVEASHSAVVTKIDEKDLYYMESRGINKATAQSMMATGLLLKDVDESLLEKLKEIIEVRINE